MSVVAFGLLIAMWIVVPWAHGATKAFRDALDRNVTIPFPPRRLISLTPGVTEMLFAIGLDREIVGVTRYCDYPPAAKERPKVGGYYDPSLEKIVALNPDLVVVAADGYNRATVEKLEKLGIACFVVNPRSLPEILTTMERLAQVTGTEDRARTRITAFRRRLDRITRFVEALSPEERVRVFYALDPRDLWTTGAGTFIHDLIVRAGAINVAAQGRKNWYQFSIEDLVVADPDYILTGRSPRQKHEDVLKEWMVRRSVPAVAEGRIVTVDNDSLSRPGPRALDVLEELVWKFHHVDFRAKDAKP